MARTYLPPRESELLTWAENFGLNIQTYLSECGLTLDQIAAYNAANDAFAAAYAAANHASTRTKSSIETKNLRKGELIAVIREYVRICQASPLMNNTIRADLQITIPDTDYTPVPPPDQAPQLDIPAVNGRTLKLRLRDSVTGERKKPAGVQGATVVSYVGETIPASLRDWTFEVNMTRTDAELTFGDAIPMGTKVWVACFWYNRKGESGPACAPVSTHLGFGAMSESPEAGEQQEAA